MLGCGVNPQVGTERFGIKPNPLAPAKALTPGPAFANPPCPRKASKGPSVLGVTGIFASGNSGTPHAGTAPIDIALVAVKTKQQTATVADVNSFTDVSSRC